MLRRHADGRLLLAVVAHLLGLLAIGTGGLVLRVLGDAGLGKVGWFYKWSRGNLSRFPQPRRERGLAGSSGVSGGPRAIL